MADGTPIWAGLDLAVGGDLVAFHRPAGLQPTDLRAAAEATLATIDLLLRYHACLDGADVHGLLQADAQRLRAALRSET